MIILTIIIMILSIAFTSIKYNTIIYSRTSILIIIFSIYLLYKKFFFFRNATSLFNGTTKYDLYISIFSIFILIIIFAIFLLTSFYPISLYLSSLNKGLKSILLNKVFDQYRISEYSLLLLFIITGGLFLMLNNDIISLFLGIELQSYGLYLLCTIYKDSENSTKAGLTYFLLGGLASCVLLLGLSVLYINLGNSSLENVYVAFDIYDSARHIINENQIHVNMTNISSCYYMLDTDILIDIILVVATVGLLFKVGAAPFHFWSPDVYDNVPTIITTSIAILAKISVLIVILGFSLFLYSIYWIKNILFSSLLSLVIGSVLGLAQSRIKRLYAYSTINHLGFILLALAINSLESIQAFTFYLIQYSITNLGAFIVLIGIGYKLINYKSKDIQIRDLKDKDNSPIQLISQLKGLFNISPLLGLSLSIIIFSFLGVPPLLGFFGKQMVLSASLDKGYVFMSIIAIITSVIGGVYYLYINRNIFFEKSIYIKESVLDRFSLSLSNSITVIISVIIILIIAFMFIPNLYLYIHDLLSIRCVDGDIFILYNRNYDSNITITTSHFTPTLQEVEQR